MTLCLGLTGCSRDSVEQNAEQELVPVTVRVSGFSITQEDFPTTRGTAISDYANLKALTLAFYKSDGSELNKLTQYKGNMSGSETFGEFSTSLPIGSYTMVVIGCSATDDASNVSLTGLTSAGYSDYVRETFATSQSVTVTGNTPLNLTATLNRIIAKVSVVSTDGRAADVHAIRTTLSGGGMGFNPTTGLSTTNTGFSNTVTTNVTVGNTTNIATALFLATDEQTMNITIETLDANNNVIFSKTIENVPLRRNRQTTLTGKMYSAGASVSSFQLDTDWLTGNSVTF